MVLPDGARHTLAQSIRLAPDLYSRLAYKLGFPLEAALSVLYVDRQSVLNAVEERERLTPGAIHHFEYPATANVSFTFFDRI